MEGESVDLTLPSPSGDGPLVHHPDSVPELEGEFGNGESPHFTAHRILSMLAAIGLFGAAFATWSAIIQIPVAGIASVLGFGAILIAVLVAVVCRTEQALRRLDIIVLVLAVLLLAAWSASQLYFYPAYGTDEAAFEQYAAQLLLQGHDPYIHSMLPALAEFRVPIQYATYTLSGTVSSVFSYPALSFLLAVPAIELTHGVQAIIVANVLFLAIEMVLLFALLPRQYRALAALVVVGLPILFGYTVAGINDTLLAPFLIVVAYRWTDVGERGNLGAAGVANAICLGLAISIQQLAWFIVPFVVLGIWRLRRPTLGRRGAFLIVGRYLALAAGSFLLVNAPFIFWHPKAWLDGVLTPLTQHAIPYGQGLVDFTVFFRFGGGNLAAYSYASFAIFGALIVVYLLYFPSLWRATFILPCIVLFFPTRSLAEYFMTLIAVWTVSVANAGSGPRSTVTGGLAVHAFHHTTAARRRRWTASLGVGAFLPAAACLVTAVVTPAPLVLQIRSVVTNGQLQGVWQMAVQATNRSRATLAPHFAANYVGQMTSFWHVTAGPAKLRPGQTATYTLVAPNLGSMPGITEPFVLQAVTATPETISSTALYTPQFFDSYITPSYVDEVEPLGRTVSLQIELRSPYGAEIRRAGVRVALGELIYAQDALIPAEATINNAPEGQTPVLAVTDSDGLATFRVRDAYIQGGNPVYFQAYVDPSVGYPYGYSEIVSVLWR
jgi:uncharacterized membrane protein